MRGAPGLRGFATYARAVGRVVHLRQALEKSSRV